MIIKFLKQEEGSTLTEAIISLSVLALGLSALLGMTAVGLRAKTISENDNMISSQLSSLYSEIRSNAKANHATTPEAVSQTAAQVCSHYRNCRCLVSKEKENLYLITIIFTTKDHREDSYCVYLSTVYL